MIVSKFQILKYSRNLLVYINSIMKGKQNKLHQMKNKDSFSNVVITVKDKNGDEIIQFEVPSGTEMKNINKILWQNKQQFEVSRQTFIGFQTIADDALFDYRLYKEIGVIKNNVSIKPLYKINKLQGLNKYKLLKCLATGGFSKVYLARSLQNGQFYAAKFVDKLKVPSEDKKVLIMNQKKVNQISDNTFLVKMHEFIQTQNFYVFIMDYCPGGELFYLLRSVKRMTQEQARIYFVQIILGIQYLHKQGIMYRDLKPQNIMLDEKGHIKIADFGLAKFYKEKSYSFCGSIEYMSPQIVTNSGHSFEVDYYCLGALLFELLVGCPPFYDPDLSQYQTKKNIAYMEVQFPDDFGLSKQAKDLIEKLLVKNPNQRLGHFGGAKEIMLHPWIGKVNRTFIESKNYEVPFPPNLSKFNFDPDEVGMSQQRFTNKIQNQYRLINAKKVLKPKTEHKQSLIVKSSIQKQKSTSPYSKKYSHSSSKKQSRKSNQGSLTNLLNKKQSYESFSNLKGILYNDLDRFSNKKRFSKNKSPSFMSIQKSDKFKKSSKIPFYVSKKFQTLKTELGDSKNYCTMDSNKLIKKKKLMTQSSQIIRDISNQFSKVQKNDISKYCKMQNYKTHKNEELRTQPNQRNNFYKSQSSNKLKICKNSQGMRKFQVLGENQKSSNLLKKSSKLKMKNFCNDQQKRGFQYGKQFRETCIV